MKKLRITVGGQSYEVTVEVLEESAPGVAPVGVPPVSSIVAAAPSAAPAAAPAAGSGSVCSPMSGSVISINAKPGDQVAAGDILLVLDAMKMENNVGAPTAGVVKEVAVKQGDTVAEGQVLFVIE